MKKTHQWHPHGRRGNSDIGRRPCYQNGRSKSELEKLVIKIMEASGRSLMPRAIRDHLLEMDHPIEVPEASILNLLENLKRAREVVRTAGGYKLWYRPQHKKSKPSGPTSKEYKDQFSTAVSNGAAAAAS